MSLINDALKKAEREKGNVPTPAESGTQGLESPFLKPGRKWHPIFPFLLSSLLGIFFIGGLIFALLTWKPSPVEDEMSLVTSDVKEVPLQPATEPPLKKTEEQPVTLLPPPATPSAPLVVQTPPSSPSPFPFFTEASFTLNGIVAGEEDAMAVINDQIVRVGEEVDGATLAEIGKDFVLLEQEGNRLRVRMKR